MMIVLNAVLLSWAIDPAGVEAGEGWIRVSFRQDTKITDTARYCFSSHICRNLKPPEFETAGNYTIAGSLKVAAIVGIVFTFFKS